MDIRTDSDIAIEAKWEEQTHIGIIGAGNIGSALAVHFGRVQYRIKSCGSAFGGEGAAGKTGLAAATGLHLARWEIELCAR